MSCTKEVIVEPIKYNVLVVGGHKEHLIFDDIMYLDGAVNMKNKINEDLCFRINNLESHNQYVITQDHYPQNYFLIMLRNDDESFTVYDQKEIFIDINVLTDSLYQGHIWGTVYNGPDILEIELHFKINLKQ